MSPWPTNIEFVRHSENVRSIAKDLNQVSRIHRALIRSGGIDAVNLTSPEVRAISRAHYMILGIWVESLLRKIVTDPTGFSAAERQTIWFNPSGTRQRPQEVQWLSTIEVAARKHFSIQAADAVSGNNTNAAFFSKYESARNLFKQHVNPIIKDRNTLAHGQWEWKLKSGSPNEFTNQQTRLNLKNYKQLHGIQEIVFNFSLIVQTVAVSNPTFDRDFSTYASRIVNAMSKTSDNDYSTYATNLQKTVPKYRK